jgi:hypothetical protein
MGFELVKGSTATQTDRKLLPYHLVIPVVGCELARLTLFGSFRCILAFDICYAENAGGVRWLREKFGLACR